MTVTLNEQFQSVDLDELAELLEKTEGSQTLLDDGFYTVKRYNHLNFGAIEVVNTCAPTSIVRVVNP
ncbi:hypothetical protein ACN1NW_000492 [Acinetobacter baumannii]|nr:hypothetical protein [Acinetobacter baumannii]ELA7031074.1 hypothetical protein [Acinetobacter baumannii]ELA7118837.1 hypothetical protein [Acinetobacter baumannii]ELB0919787.1 hypothetical protein [Acinetobacter baumannii]ELB0965964.1 hypothetical protein [Acinetobacter baumannii]